MPKRRIPRSRLACLLLLAAAASGLLAPSPGFADASGCTYHADTEPLDDVSCGYPGPGCYLCEYSYIGQPGYTECAESPDGAIRKCKRGVLPQHQYSGSTATAAPITPARGASGSRGALSLTAPVEAPPIGA